MRYLACIALLMFAACSSKQTQSAKAIHDGSVAFEAASFDQIDGWREDSLTPAFAAFLKSIPKIGTRPHWQAVCEAALSVEANDEVAVRRFFENNFQAYSLSDSRENQTGLITGYYEPLLRGSRTKSSVYQYPVYTKPADLITVDLAAAHPDLKHHRLRGRLEGKRVVPYYTRREIDGVVDPLKSPLKGSEIFWVESKIDLYFLHVQGSGRIRLDTGETVMVGYNNHNGHPYTSIGKLLVTLGEITAKDISMPSIKRWFTAFPNRFEEICYTNDRYIFFREADSSLSGPVGALNVPLTAERSIAVDRRHVELGTPVFLSTRYPDSKKPFRQLMMAQDAGSAIVGRIRADLFWGFGTTAQRRAGVMKEEGRMWILLPNGVQPGEIEL